MNTKEKIPCSGVYFLFEGDEVVYVGQGANPMARINTHLIDKKFDSYYVVPCDEENLNQTEAEYITKYLPKYNKSMPQSPSSRGVGRLLPEQRDQNIIIKGSILSNCLYLDLSGFDFDLERAINAEQRNKY